MNDYWTDYSTLQFTETLSTDMLIRPKTLALVGSHPRTKELAPWDDESIDIWVFNEAANIPWCKRANGVFQLHLPEIYRSPFNRTDPKHWEWLQQKHGIPIWMQDVDPLVPDSVRYPLEEITSLYLGNFKWADGEVIRFYTNTPAYAIALAIYQGYEKILTFGMDMESSTEYKYQRDNVAFWTGLALGRGIEIEEHCSEALFATPLYGYDGQITYTIEEFQSERSYLLEEAKKAFERWEAAKAAEDLNSPDYVEQHSALIDATIEKGKATGMLQELDRFLGRYEFGTERQEFEACAASGKTNWDHFTSMMNYESGRAQAYFDIGDLERYAKATEQQLDMAFSSGIEMGKYQFGYQHMTVLDDRIVAAGGRKSVEIARENMGLQPKE